MPALARRYYVVSHFDDDVDNDLNGQRKSEVSVNSKPGKSTSKESKSEVPVVSKPSKQKGTLQEEEARLAREGTSKYTKEARLARKHTTDAKV
jgi:hypothetical protein